MKIIYVHDDREKRYALQKNHNNIIILQADKWDDFDYKTRFPVYCKIDDEEVEMDAIKILIDDEFSSHEYLKQLISKGWNGVFPIPDTNYISVPESITFYEQIIGRLDLSETTNIAKTLRDASYLTRIEEDYKSIALINNQGFDTSLLRERGAEKAYQDGWLLFGDEDINVNNIQINFIDTKQQEQTILFNFDSQSSLLSLEIHALIGPNGIGKSQLLHQIVKNWLKNDKTEKNNFFERKPNLSQITVISYSPFERFPLNSFNETNDLKSKIKDEGIYRYSGLRTHGEKTTDELSIQTPKINATDSLVSCIEDDKKFSTIRDWSNKVKTMENVLKSAIDFDYLALSISDFENEDTFFENNTWNTSPIFYSEKTNKNQPTSSKAYLTITSDEDITYNSENIRLHLNREDGIVFIKDESPIQLSSGQRLFSYMIANILGSMRRNSLILIDEPEAFLHPTLELQLIEMLKKILSAYNSKAILATHSPVIVRELPKECVHVFKKTNEDIFINNPPFETFGADIQKISSYVFEDRSSTKSYENFLVKKLEEYGTAESLITALGDNINEELIIQIHAMEKGKW